MDNLPEIGKKLKEALKKVTENPILTTFIIFIILSLAIFTLSSPYYNDNPEAYIKDVLIEAHGMILDLAIIGILLYWLNKNGEKRIRIRHYKDEIEDVRNWNSEEATFKILGNIKRLTREKIYNIDLYKCHLQKINLSFMKLTGSNLNYADLSEAILSGAELTRAKVNHTILKGANLNKCNLSASHLNGAVFTDAKGIQVNFKGCFLIRADFSRSKLIEPVFLNCELSGADFTDAILYKPDFTGAQGLAIEQIAAVRKIEKPVYDPQFEQELRKYLRERQEKNKPAGVKQ